MNNRANIVKTSTFTESNYYKFSTLPFWRVRSRYKAKKLSCIALFCAFVVYFILTAATVIHFIQRIIMNCILELKALSKFYTAGQSVVVGLNSVDLSFSVGEFVAVTGESGSGKSTLAHVLGGILPYESGEMLLYGNPTSHYDGTDWEHYRRDSISFISQSYGILLGNTVLGNVTSALRLTGSTEKEAVKKAEEILKKVELWDARKRRAAKLSSGQKQRLSIARALAKPAKILIADEPTGNLDSENSAKVIRMLRDAAKDRLVIIITHDYAEVEAHATRRIIIKDGKVIADIKLRDTVETEKSDICEKQDLTAKTQNNKKSGNLSVYVAGLQLKMHPVWCFIMQIFFTVTAFAVFAFLGTFITAIDDTNTRIYSDLAFRNGNMERIVVQRIDSGEITAEDIEKIKNASHVERIEKYGYVTDVNYYYREDVDYRCVTSIVDVSKPGALSPSYQKTTSVTFFETGLFLQTVPIFAAGDREFLTAGRLPESYWEIVLGGDSSRIGESIPIYVRNEKEWSSDLYYVINATVVGTTDGEGIYFHDDVGRQITSKAISDNRYFYLPKAPSSYTEEDSKLKEDDSWFRCTQRCLTVLRQSYKDIYKDENGIVSYPFYNTDSKSYVLLTPANEMMPIDESVYSGDLFIEVSANKFNELITSGTGNQLSVFITDYAYAERVIEELNGLGYIALSPFKNGSTTQDPTLAKERMSTLTVCAIALAAVLLLQIILLRALFSMQTESYSLLANIGLTCATAQRSVLWQLLLFTIFGQFFGFGGIFICHRLDVNRITDLVKYLEPAHVAILSAIHIAAALFGTLWVISSLKKQVFPFTERYSDISFDEEEAGE